MRPEGHTEFCRPENFSLCWIH